MAECLKPMVGFYDQKGVHHIGLPHFLHGFRLHEIPCGYCDTCLTNKTRNKGFKCFLTIKEIADCSFITVTYNKENLPLSPSGLPTLDKNAFPKFMKRLRKQNPGKTIGAMYAGEYGDDHSRPHFHAIIFGHKFTDLEYKGLSPKGYVTYTSAQLQKLWPFGFSEVGTATIEAATYIAGYIYKKKYGKNKTDHYGDRTPEYCVSPKKNFVLGRDHIRKHINSISQDGCLTGPDGQKYNIDTHTLNWISREMPEQALLIRIQKESLEHKNYENKKEALAAKAANIKQLKERKLR